MYLLYHSQILEAFHHPWFASRSRIQEEMFQTLQTWVSELENVEETIQALSKVSITIPLLEVNCLLDPGW